jgi:glutathione S-transferase
LLVVPVDGRRCRRLRAGQSKHLLPRRSHAGKGAGFGGQVLRRHRFVNLWRFADEQLAKTQYLAGDEITAADLAVYPIYAGRKALPDNAGLKHLQAWGERIGSRPGVQKGMKLET